jgi:hypothetical protein
MINDLPELNDLGAGGDIPAPAMQSQARPEIGRPDPVFEQSIANKYIRKTHQPPNMDFAPPPQLPPQFEQEVQPQGPVRQGLDPLYDISCLQISMHIKNCPVCSKIYNSDKSLYIIFIVLLFILSMLLMKKILEKN